jgi:hypothetical protein
LKTRIAFVPLFLLFLALAVVPTVAQDLYDNGPTNGNTNAWNIGNGFIVSNGFTCCREDGPENSYTVTGFSFAAWLFPGDTLTSAELSITSAENGGTSFFDETVNFTQSACVTNQYGYNVCTETSSFSGPTLNGGTYWINLQNGSTPSGDPVYWDENSGPSMASQNTVGTIPSEAFTVIGSVNTTSTTTTTSTGSVPEPSSVMLFGSGLIGLAGWLRRRFHP